MKHENTDILLRRLEELENKVDRLTQSEMSSDLFLEFRFLFQGEQILTGICDTTACNGIIKKKFSVLKAQYALTRKGRAEFVVCLVSKNDRASTISEFYISGESFMKITGFIPNVEEFFEFDNSFKAYCASLDQSEKRSEQCAS
ncbi:hypothetical protein [Sulfurospirillum halorespirans]|uniref:Uncharacterized protein n=1 Tax=Sulfurospirillum halorespirans DSM 13726 TaxID=1193502 RepID=A0A1D7TFS7_9BACT|nr:hypothetical protein [Sulfurospirillum halorespirans]AOO63872.1 hypothetical protein SHALO_0070 [Sulfurospirillum halorespirans DSM 13726]